MRKNTDVLTEKEARDLIGWHWRRRRLRGRWYLCKYERKRRVHNSVAIALGWEIGTRGATGAGLISTLAELRRHIDEGWVPQQTKGLTWVVRGDVRRQVHPDLNGVLQLEIRGPAPALTKNCGTLSFVPARAREKFTAGLKRRSLRKGTRIQRSNPRS